MDTMNNSGNDAIDLRELLGVLKKLFLVIVVITLAAVIAGGILAYYVMVPVYQTEVVLLASQASKQSSSGQKGEGMAGVVNSISKLPEMTLNTYLVQMKSEAVLEGVVKKLKLDKLGYSGKSLAGNIRVETVKDSNMVKLIVTHTNPYLAAQIANTVPQEFFNYIAETNEQQMNKSVEFLKKQAASTGEELKKATANLNNLQSQPRGIEMLDKLISTKIEDLSKYESQSIQADMEYQQALAGLNQAGAQLKNTPATISVTNFDEITGKLDEKEVVNPAYSQLKLMYNEKSVIVAEKGVVSRSLQGIINKLNSELKALQAEVGQKKSLLQSATSEVKRLQETNSLLRTKLDEANITKSAKLGEAILSIVSPAGVPGGPVAPDRPKIMLAAFAAGLMASIGLVFLLNYFDNTVKTAKDLEEILGVPVVGQIPSYNPKKIGAIGRY